MPLSIQKFLLTTCLMLPLSCIAGAMGNVENGKIWSIALQGGVFWASQGKSQHINIASLVGNNYTVEHHSQTGGLAGIGLYFNGYCHERFLLSYGLNLFYLSQTKVSGNIVEESIFTNLSYRYNIRNIPLYAAAKAIIFTDNPRYNITLDAGIGPNFIRTSNYQERPLVDFITPNQAYKGDSRTTFSATAGVGIRINNILGSMPLECGYRFFYLGKGSLKTVNNQYLNSLSTGKTHANALICSITV